VSADAKQPDLKRILDLLPHRYPFLLIDRVLEIDKSRVLTLKNVTFNEPYFQGHFPGVPVMPGVLIIEAMAQSAAVLALTAVSADPSLLFMLTGVDKVRFRRRVVPGDQLKLEVKILKYHRPLWRMSARASVDGEVAADAELSAMEVKEKVR
jgi:3-hydroxyacyl-[acyl-carrier-protein] dehydratase